jgi:hypothetical protein
MILARGSQTHLLFSESREAPFRNPGFVIGIRETACDCLFRIPPVYNVAFYHLFLCNILFQSSTSLNFSTMPKLGQPSTLGNYTLGEKREIARVNALTDRQVRWELTVIMRGIGYSWYTISQRLQAGVCLNRLDMEHFEPGNIPYEWNVLCDEKVSWQLRGRPSFRSFRFNRDCLTRLKIIPSQAGLGLDCNYLFQ